MAVILNTKQIVPEVLPAEHKRVTRGFDRCPLAIMFLPDRLRYVIIMLFCYFITHTHTHSINFLASITVCVIHVVTWSLGLRSNQLYALLKSVSATDKSHSSELPRFSRDLFGRLRFTLKQKTPSFSCSAKVHFRV
jgi:hypothetical protein